MVQQLHDLPPKRQRSQIFAFPLQHIENMQRFSDAFPIDEKVPWKCQCTFPD